MCLTSCHSAGLIQLPCCHAPVCARSRVPLGQCGRMAVARAAASRQLPCTWVHPRVQDIPKGFSIEGYNGEACRICLSLHSPLPLALAYTHFARTVCAAGVYALLVHTRHMCTALDTCVVRPCTAVCTAYMPSDIFCVPLCLCTAASDLEEIWMYKHRLLLRLARVGANVLYMDVDSIVFDDPYQWV